MSNLRSAFVRQFGKPSGFLGSLAGFIMTVRPSNRERNLRTLELLAIRPDDHVLEVGFGPGLSIRMAAELANRGLVFGFDHSEVMLWQAQRRNARALATGKVQLMLGSAENLPPLPVRFDKVLAINVYMFWADPVAVLRGLHGIMNSGAQIALTMQPRKRGASIADTRKGADRISASLREAGFQAVRVEILPLKPVPAACVLATVGQASGGGFGA